MLGRVLDETYDHDVRGNVTLLTVGRFAGNAAYRFPVPFLATIASGLHVSLGTLGVGLAITELVALSAPIVGRMVERTTRRTSMTAGLLGIAVGALLAAAATHLWVFVVALSILSVAKVTYDIALGGWIADRVPFEVRSRVISLTETSWSLGLLVGVSALALVVAVSSWNVAYVVIAAVVLGAAAALHRRLPHEDHPGAVTAHEAQATRDNQSPWRLIIVTAAAVGALAGSAQFMFVTYGSWLEDEFDFTPAKLAAVTFGLGAVELVSSIVSVGRTDRWGKERCVVIGAALMAPGAAIVGIGAHHLPSMLGGLALFLMGFELAIISGLPLGALLTPGAPAKGLGMLIGGVTLTRAAVAIPATRWYEHHGMATSAIGSVVLAAIAATLITARGRLT